MKEKGEKGKKYFKECNAMAVHIPGWLF